MSFRMLIAHSQVCFEIWRFLFVVFSKQRKVKEWDKVDSSLINNAIDGEYKKMLTVVNA